MNRYRLLYFIYKKGKIEARPGLKATLAKLFKYKSDGHFYPDWNFLVDGKFIEEKDGYIVATKKTNQELIAYSVTNNHFLMPCSRLFPYNILFIGFDRGGTEHICYLFFCCYVIWIRSVFLQDLFEVFLNTLENLNRRLTFPLKNAYLF